MEQYYHIAGIDVCIKGKSEELCSQNHRLDAFRSEKKVQSYEYNFSVEEKLEDGSGVCVFHGPARRVFQDGSKKIHYIGPVTEHLEKAYIRCEIDEKEAHVQVKKKSLQDRITEKVILSSMNIEGLVLKHHAFILHASFIEVNGQAVLFTAPSGTGKSTQAELWKQYRGAEIMNGDRAAVKIEGTAVTACGIPFAGSSQYCKNASLPVAAVVYLSQSEETKIEAFQGMRAFKSIWKEVTVPIWEDYAMERISDMVLTMINNVPVYHLSCTPDESAVIALENVLNGEV